MKLADLIRHIADNEEAGNDRYSGLDFSPNGAPNWSDVIDNPEWFSLKPKTHTVNGFEVPAPMSEEPEIKDKYFIPDLKCDYFVFGYQYADDATDRLLFERGLCFHTEAAAAANAKAMLRIDPNK